MVHYQAFQPSIYNDCVVITFTWVIFQLQSVVTSEFSTESDLYPETGCRDNLKTVLKLPLGDYSKHRTIKGRVGWRGVMKSWSYRWGMKS